MYLGALISNAPLSVQVREHADAKASQLFKFNSFLYKNSDAPFKVKKTVWHSAMSSSVLYACETWLCERYPRIEKLYLNSIKSLLGVRSTTSNILVLVEVGLNSLKGTVLGRQARFIKKLVERPGFYDSYIGKAVSLAVNSRCPAGRILNRLLNNVRVPDLHSLCGQVVANREKSRFATYLMVNPELMEGWLY